MTSPFAIVVDATPLAGVAAGSGIGTYIRNLLGALNDLPDVQPIALCSDQTSLPTGMERIPIRRLSRWIPEHPRADTIEHAVRLPVELWRARPRGAVFHNPTYHAPLGVGGPFVQTLHDVIPLVFDAPDQAVLRARWKRFGPRYRKADAIVAVSHHAAQEGTRTLDLDPDRIYIAPHGVPPGFCPGPPRAEHAEPPYLLVVGEYSERKGFDLAFAVADQLAVAGYPHRLVVAGRVHPWGAADLARLHAATRHPGRIEIRGYVDDLVKLYQGASCFIMPSQYEGFGLPALEAMACGVPVVAFENSSLTEVVGGGGQLVPNADVGAMVAAVRAVLDNPSVAREWAARGLAHTRRFTWEAAAAVHVEAYRSALERSGRR